VSPDPSPQPDRRQPIRLLEWRDEDDGTITVLRPKFGTGRLGRWLSSRLAHPYCRVRLDEYGSFVWKCCDGRRTVDDIAQALREQSQDTANDLRTRLLFFFRRLERERLIGWVCRERG
jgi:hypothetical protein